MMGVEHLASNNIHWGKNILLAVIFLIMFKNMRRFFVCAVTEKGSKMPNINNSSPSQVI